MKKYRLGKLLSDTRQILRENYLALASVTAVFAVVYWLFVRLNPELLDLTSLKGEDAFEVLTNLLISQLLTHVFLKKYYLILIRQPEVVKANFFQALKHTFTDGFSRRLKYHTLYLLTHLLLYLLLGCLFVLGVYQLQDDSVFSDFSFSSLLQLSVAAPVWLKWLSVLSLFLIHAPFFMVPYIIQDTLSDDNILIPLTYWGCVRQSFRLMKGHHRIYFALTAFSFLVEYIYINMVSRVILTLIWSPLSFLSVAFLLIVTFVKFVTADTFVTTANAVLADVLLTEEWQIAFFGGKDE